MPGVEQELDAIAERPLDVVRIGRSPARPLRFALVAVIGRPHAAHTARAIASAGTRTPTVPVPPRHLARQRRRGAGISSVSGPGQNRSARRARRRGQPAEMRGDLRDVGGDQRQRAVGGAALHREHARDGGRAERIGREPVQRVGRNRDDAAGANPLGGLLDGVALRRSGIDDTRDASAFQSTHQSFIVDTAAASAAMHDAGRRGTRRGSRVPPRNPAMNGLLAMPTSDALVSTPKPVPCAPAGITLPAALYDAVIAAPMPRPSSADAAHISQTLPLTPTSAEPAAATAAPPAITTRVGKRFSSRAAEVMAERAGARHDREQHARRRSRTRACATPDLLDVQRQHRAEAAVDELQPEDHGHHQDEILEREHVAERDARRVVGGVGRRARASRGRRTSRARRTRPTA